jgi:preprotein translocase subunit YajC
MANEPISAADMQDFIPTIIAGKTLEYIRGDVVFPKLSIVDFSPDVASMGETVNIPKLSNYTAKDKAAKTPTELQDMVSDVVAVTLNKHKYVQFLLEDVAMAKAKPGLIDLHSRAAANALIEAIEADFAALFDTCYINGTGTITATAASDAVVGVGTLFTSQLKVGDKIKTAGGVVREVATITDNTHLTVDSVYSATESGVAFTFIQQSVFATTITDAAIVEARRRLRKNKANVNELTFVSSLDDYAALLNLSTYRDASTINEGSLRKGALGQIRGFEVWEDNAFEKAYSAAFSPMSIGAAFRVLEPVKDAWKSAVVNDPESGLGVRVTVKYSDNDLGYKVTIDLLYGVAVIDPTQIVRLAAAL